MAAHTYFAEITSLQWRRDTYRTSILSSSNWATCLMWPIGRTTATEGGVQIPV